MSTFKRQSNTFYASKNNQHFLLNISTSEYFYINSAAALVWTLLDKPMSPNSLILHLKRKSLNFDTHQIEHKLHDFLFELVRYNLITISSSPSCK